MNETLNLQPLVLLPDLTNLSIGTGTLNEKAFVDISKIDSLQTLHLFSCRFDGEHLQHLQQLPHLDTLSLHNIHPEAAYESYIMGESGNLQPNGTPGFRFDEVTMFCKGNPRRSPQIATING